MKPGSIFERQAPTEWKEKWRRNIDFLFVCTGFCTGLGNLWRFPNVAMEYGGGSFLIVYVFLLFSVMFPIFYLEAVLGQFLSRAGARAFDCVPLMRGLGYGQVLLAVTVASYFSGLSSIAGKYIISSIRFVLPWTLDADKNDGYNGTVFNNKTTFSMEDNRSLAELYYRQHVMPNVKELSTGFLFIPNYELLIYLIICWVAAAWIVHKGLRLLNQLGCFLGFAIISILIVIFVQAIIMPGGVDGVIHFFKINPREFGKLDLWFAALVQGFFSIGVCFGSVTMYASFNKFSYNMFSELLIAMFFNILIILIAGCTFFAAVGNIVQSHEMDYDDIRTRYSRNMFVIYSEVIAKFEYLPQVSSAIFFALFYLSGIGSVAALMFFSVQMVRDEFFIKKVGKLTIPMAFAMFTLSVIFSTPFGEPLINLLDLYGVSCAIAVSGFIELITLSYLYGVKRICDDIEFMFGFRTRTLWRMLWYGVPVTITLIVVCYLAYIAIQLSTTNSEEISVSLVGVVVGLVFIFLILLAIAIWSTYVIMKQPDSPFCKRVLSASRPEPNWGPAETSLLLNYRYFILKKDNTTT